MDLSAPGGISLPSTIDCELVVLPLIAAVMFNLNSSIQSYDSVIQIKRSTISGKYLGVKDELMTIPEKYRNFSSQKINANHALEELSTIISQLTRKYKERL